MTQKEFSEKVAVAVSRLKQMNPKEAVLIHHDDADGLCSAAIIKAALERENCKAKTLCLEKVYPEVIESLHKKSGQLIFYADIGSSHADFISKCNRSQNFTIILDHHDPTLANDPEVLDLNLEHYGFRGETDFSGATCCYLFAEALNKNNLDLSYLALVGSCEIPSGFVGLNKAVLDKALKARIVAPKGKTFEIVKSGVRVDNLFSMLQILGAAGYYEGGPELGVKACLEGVSEEAKRKIDDLETRRKEANKRLIARLYRERLKEAEHMQWFDAGDVYAGMGTKVIGQFCSFLSYQSRLIKQDKYILGFMNVPPEIPNWGKLKGNFVKVSVRVPKAMQKLIDEKKMPSAVDLLMKASEGFGFADGHEYAANVVLPNEKLSMFLENAEHIICAR